MNMDLDLQSSFCTCAPVKSSRRGPVIATDGDHKQFSHKRMEKQSARAGKPSTFMFEGLSRTMDVNAGCPPDCDKAAGGVVM